MTFFSWPEASASKLCRQRASRGGRLSSSGGSSSGGDGMAPIVSWAQASTPRLCPRTKALQQQRREQLSDTGGARRAGRPGGINVHARGIALACEPKGARLYM
jgi:hypothetical protein